MGVMDDYREHQRSGWRFHEQPLTYTCGHCGSTVTTVLGFNRSLENTDFGFPILIHEIRMCPRCYYASNIRYRAGKLSLQFPRPLLGEHFDAKSKSSEVQQIVNLYDESRKAISLGGSSCGVLMFRKLLMHIAADQGAPAGSFESYCEWLKTNNIVAKPQHSIPDRVRKAGNTENHEVRIATDEEASNLLDLVTLLIRSVYFIK